MVRSARSCSFLACGTMKDYRYVPFRPRPSPSDGQSISKWSDYTVRTSLYLGITSAIGFLVIELFLAREPVLAPFLLKQKIPVLVAMSSFLVPLCTFSIMYFFPLWFQAVMMTSASTAGKHQLSINERDVIP